MDHSLASMTDIYSMANDSKHRRQNAYKNLEFAKALFISKVGNTTNESWLTLKEAPISNKKQSTTIEEAESQKLWVV